MYSRQRQSTGCCWDVDEIIVEMLYTNEAAAHMNGAAIRNELGQEWHFFVTPNFHNLQIYVKCSHNLSPSSNRSQENSDREALTMQLF